MGLSSEHKPKLESHNLFCAWLNVYVVDFSALTFSRVGWSKASEGSQLLRLLLP